jgi:molecular chaperone GrpE (heat shock protein)
VPDPQGRDTQETRTLQPLWPKYTGKHQRMDPLARQTKSRVVMFMLEHMHLTVLTCNVVVECSKDEEEEEEEEAGEDSDDGASQVLDPAAKKLNKKALSTLGSVQQLLTQVRGAKGKLNGTSRVHKSMKMQFEDIEKELLSCRGNFEKALSKNTPAAKLEGMLAEANDLATVVSPLLVAAERVSAPTKK